MDKRLSGKTAIVTGASRGIGRAIARRLADDGAHTVVCARDAKLLATAVSEIEKHGGSAASFVADLRLPEAPTALAAFAMKTYGQIDVVVNNAGATKSGDFLNFSDDDWADGFALKFFGAVRLTRAAWPHLKASSGSVVNVIGVGGRMPGPQFAIGGSVNAALLSFTKAISEVGIRDHVQVNAINPGNVRTERFQKRLETFMSQHGVDAETAEQRIVAAANTTRIGEPEDIAALTAFVVSPEARFLQGALIDMDGGATKVI